MSNLNWPESATHYGAETLQFNPGFYKKDGNTWLFMSEYFAPNGCWNRANKDDDPSRYIERPSEQSKPWSGPEDGFPSSSWCSVGKMVQVMSLPTHHHEDVSIYLSKPSKIVASYTDDDGDSFLMLRIDCDFGTGYECFAAHRVLPAKTEKQIAADKRETAIRELMDIAQVDCRVTAARLVDAGFKREVV